MKKKVIFQLIVMCMTLLFCHELYAQESMTKMKKTYPVAMQEYGKQMDELKTDYIIAIDVSATMGKHKNEVIPALTRFFDSIGDGNFVRIISFGTMAKEEQTRLEISKQTRPQIVSKLNYVYDNVMNDPGMRGHTDFVLLGNKVVDLVEKDQDSDIHFLVIFSDIMDDPQKKASGSRHRDTKEWNELHQRFAKLNVPVNTLSTYFSHETKDEKQILESIELVRKTFPNFDYSSDINEVLGAKLEDSKFIIYTDKLKLLISKDLNEAGKKELFSSQIDKDKSVSLIFNFDKDDLNVKKYIRGIAVDTCILSDKSNDIIDVEFDNKEVSKRSGSKGIGNAKFEEGDIWTKDCFVEYTMNYHFLYQQGRNDKAPSFTKDMEALGLLDKNPQTVDLRAEGKLVYIWPYWLICVLATAAILYLLLFIYNTIIPHKIRNKKLVVKNTLTGDVKIYEVAGKHSFTIGNQKCNYVIPGALFALKATYSNGSPLNLLCKRRLTLKFVSKSNSGIDMSQGTRNNLKKVSIRKGKDALITQNITTRYLLSLSKK